MIGYALVSNPYFNPERFQDVELSRKQCIESKSYTHLHKSTQYQEEYDASVCPPQDNRGAYRPHSWPREVLALSCTARKEKG